MRQNNSISDLLLNYNFEEAFEIAKQMEAEKIIESLESLSYKFGERINMIPFIFAYKYKLLIDDIKWNSILMELIATCYIWYIGMPDTILECAKKILAIDPNNKKALQMIIYLYEECECNCSEEFYNNVKAKMDELGYTMED